MYNSQYYTCEQIDQRLLQGYLDDYNTENGTSLTKAQFLQMLSTMIGKSTTVDNLVAQLGYCECDTAAGTAAKAITVTNYTLFAGGSMKVKFVNKNTANNATLNINSQGAKALYYDGERASANNSWEAGETVEVYYDGTSFYANSVAGGGKFATGEKVKEVGIDDEPTAGSENLVKSGGVAKKFAETVGEYLNIASSTTEVNKLINSTGQIVNRNAFNCYRWDVEQYASIKIKVPSTATQSSNYSAFFSEDTQLVSTPENTSNYRTEKELSVPEGAKYFIVSIYNNFTVDSINISGIFKSSLQNRVDGIEQTTINNSAAISTLNDAVGLHTDIIEWHNSGYVLGSSGYLSVSSSTNVSARIVKLGIGDKIICTISPTVSVPGGYTEQDLSNMTEADVYNEHIQLTTLSSSIVVNNRLELVSEKDCYYIFNVASNRNITIIKANNIDKLNTKVGDIQDLDTEDKTNIVNAVNEINTKVEESGSSKIGDLEDLETEDKENIVAAINEVVESMPTPSTTYIGLATQEISNDVDVQSVGEELINDNSWTLSEGWTRDGNTFVHTSGTGNLTNSISGLVSGKLYQVSFDITNTNTQGFSSIYVTLGGSPIFETYNGGGNVHFDYGIVAGSSDTLLQFIPGTWVSGGTISNVSVKEVTNSVKPFVIYKDSNSLRALDIISPRNNKGSILIGTGNTKCFWGEGNTALGKNAMSKVTSGFWNTALGLLALENVDNGSRNIAIGYIALRHLVSGDRNIAIGTFAMEGSTSGRNNIAIGADAMQGCNGNSNVGIGTRAGIGISTGERNTAVGYNSATSIGSGKANVAVGANTLVSKSSADFNVAVGCNSQQYSTGGSYNTAVGGFSLERNSGEGNTAIGYQSGWSANVNGNNNTLIGRGTSTSQSVSNSTALGYGAIATKSNQVVLGNESVDELIIGNKKIIFNQDGTVSWEAVS